MNEPKIVYIPFNINIALYCEKESYERVERRLLKNLPENFTKGLLDFFDADFISQVSLVSSFFRTGDLIDYLAENEDDYLNDLNIRIDYSKKFIIPYESFQINYYQKDLSQSRTLGSVYDKNRDNPNDIASTYYTLQGILYYEKQKGEEIHEFLQEFYEKYKRAELMEGFNNLFLEINEKEKSNAEAIFIDVTAYTFSSMIEALKEFDDFTNISKHSDLTLLRHYSIHRESVVIPWIKEYFSNLFGKSRKNQ